MRFYIINDNADTAAVSVLKLKSDNLYLYWKFDNSSQVQPPSGPIAKALIFYFSLSKLSPEMSKHELKIE